MDPESMSSAILWAAIFLVFFGFGIFLLGIPFQGVVIRFRVNYTPHGVNLSDGMDEEQQRLTNDPRVGPVVTSFLAMAARVRRIEGWSGLYKGFMPVILMGMFQAFLGSIIIGSGGAFSISSGGIVTTILWTIIVVVLIQIPRTVLVNRAITTPHKLAWFAPRASIKALFTTYERRRPWAIFTTPGLALSQTLEMLWFHGIARFARHLLIPSLHPRESPFPTETGFLAVMGMVAYGFFLIGSTLVLTPLEVVSARLSVQRNHPAGSAEVPEADGEGSGLEFAGADEDVIGLRDEDQPYLGLADALKKIVDEEGWKTLYRAWYLTLLLALFSGLA